MKIPAYGLVLHATTCCSHEPMVEDVVSHLPEVRVMIRAHHDHHNKSSQLDLALLLVVERSSAAYLDALGKQ